MKRSEWLKETREKSVEALKDQLTNILRTNFSLNLKKYGDGLEKTHLFKENKRMVARIKTILTERANEGKENARAK